MKKIIKILLPLMAYSSVVSADDTGITVKPQGSFDFTTIYRDDNAPKDFKYMTSNKKDFGLAKAFFIL